MGYLFGPAVARWSVGLFVVLSRFVFDSELVAQSSIFTRRACWLDEKLQFVPRCWSASMTNAAQPATNGEDIDVPWML